MADKYLKINDDLEIFFKSGEARHLGSKYDPETVERAVYRWQELQANHPDIEFSEKWLQAYRPPSQGRDLAEALGISEHQAGKMLPRVRAIRDDYQDAVPGRSDQEAQKAVLDLLRKVSVGRSSRGST